MNPLSLIKALMFLEIAMYGNIVETAGPKATKQFYTFQRKILEKQQWLL